MLVELIYCSRVNANITAQEINRILTTSQRNNHAAGLTGTLVFTGTIFLQCLEGDRDEVNKAYHRIAVDGRHEHPVILGMKEISRRSFGAWSMGYIGYTAENRALFLAYSVRSEFDPYELGAEPVGSLLRELASSARMLAPTQSA